MADGRGIARKTEERRGRHRKLHQKVFFYFYKQQTLGRKAELKWTQKYGFNRSINHKIISTLAIKAHYKTAVMKTVVLASGQKDTEQKGEKTRMRMDKGDVPEPRKKGICFQSI